MRILYGVLFISSCLVSRFDGAIDFKRARVSLLKVSLQNVLKVIVFSQDSHRGSAASTDQIRKIAALEDTADFKKLLDPIMVPRVVGTPSHEKVKNV